MNRGIALLAGLTLGFAASAASASEIVSSTCTAPDDALGNAASLPRAAEFLKHGATLNVLAIGSSTIFGPEASLRPGSLTSQAIDGATVTTVPSAQVLQQQATETAFPQQMARSLETAIPGLKVTMTVRGGRGLTAEDQLQLLTDALRQGHFALVLWQSGTVEAARNLPPSEFASTLADGTARVEQAGADLVLIDPQFSRFLQTNTNLEPYEQVFQQLSSVPGVALFRRFDLMHSWANDGRIDLERTAKAERRHAVEQLHLCLGQQLAKLIMLGAHQ